jgi:hypothetical protein
MATTLRYDSPDGGLRLLIVHADDGDVSLGFENCAWHTHADLLASTYGMSNERAIERFVSELMDNRAVIAISTLNGAIRDIWISDDPQKDVRYLPEEEIVEFRHWDGSRVK